MKFLLTNDDSHRSPLLKSVIEKLEELGELTIVLPAEEQSWKGKSMSRHSPIHLDEEEIFGRKVHTVSGTPADCVNFAIHHLMDEKPDLVVSGVNAGTNSGASFIFSSGTLGACFEGNIAGIPGLALSQHFDSETYARYFSEGTYEQETLERVNAQSGRIMDMIFKTFSENPGFLECPLTWNVNYPFKLGEESEVRVCHVDNMRYGSCFAKHDTHYSHHLSEAYPSMEPLSDYTELKEGHVSITPLDIFSFGKLDEDSLKSLSDTWNKKIL